MLPAGAGPSTLVQRLTGGLLLPGLLLLCGCAAPAFDAARENFYQGRFKAADFDLADAAILEKDRVLCLMERGTIRQALGSYAESSRDYLAAAQRLQDLWTISLSKGAASIVANDNALDFDGAPYERTLLHAFTAKNYLIQGNWEDAAVEARLIIRSLAPESRGEYPEDAYSRYIAGFCLEMLDDPANAAIQYRRAAELARGVAIGERGRIVPALSADGAPAVAAPLGSAELVCFVLIGRSPHLHPERRRRRHLGLPGYAEISAGGRVLGRSYPLTDVAELAFTSSQIAAAGKAAKTIARVVLKEAISDAVASKNNEALGELVRFILIGLLEEPDVRRWETLPRSLQVARVPCPSSFQGYTVTFKDWAGNALTTLDVKQPLVRRGNVFVSFCRDYPRIPPS
ncbi:MAG: hypothetical protein QME60_07860 [Verrucomicrobiota bacterium]|nr:hypothetical protein [Verrucomicrobiota bacterium]